MSKQEQIQYVKDAYSSKRIYVIDYKGKTADTDMPWLSIKNKYIHLFYNRKT